MSRIIFAYSLLLTIASFGQKANVELTINPTNVEAGESFNITIKSNVQGDGDIENLPASFVQDYSIQTGQYPEMDHNTGSVTTIYFVSYSGIITKPGDYTVGPAYIKSGNKVYKSNKVKMKVGSKVAMSSGQITASQLNDPAFGVIETNKKVIYEGEPVLLAAKIYSYYDPSNIGGYQSYNVNSAVVKHPIGNSNNIKVTEEVIRGNRLYVFNYDKNVIFPDGVGKFRIDPFKLKLYQGYKSFPVTSNSLDIEIKPLPANPPKDFIGGVGDLRIERTLDSVSILQGVVIKMNILVSGIGNLQNLLEPKLDLPSGFIIYGDPVITENVTVGIHGAEGSVDYEYNLQVTKHGDIKLPATTISFFNPKQEKYIQVASNETDLKVKRNKKYIVHETDNQTETPEEISSRDLTPRKKSDVRNRGQFYGTPLFWGGVSLPLLASVFFILFAKRRERSADKIEKKQILRDKRGELAQLTAQLKIAASGYDESFLSNAENVIKKAFEIKMQIDSEKVLNKSEIYDYLQTHGMSSLEPKVKSVFDELEQSRYGLATSYSSNEAIVREIEFIIEQLG